jgi:hypothetical protein
MLQPCAMSGRFDPILIALSAGPAIGSAASAEVAPFVVAVRGPATACTIEVAGRRVTLDELLAIARRQPKPKRHARIVSDMGPAPYRCIGGAIYTLQRAGFENVAFDAGQPPRP